MRMVMMERGLDVQNPADPSKIFVRAQTANPEDGSKRDLGGG